jgi:HEAT repeats/PBS lyase HEAT-like repeat
VKLRIFLFRLLVFTAIGSCLFPGGVGGAQSTCASVEDCLKDLKSHDVAKKSAAIFMLGNLKDKQATPALVELLRHEEDSGLRLSAIKAISSLRDPATVKILTDLLGDKDLQQEVVGALVKIANKTAVEALIGGLKHPEIQEAAARGLGEIADPSAKPALIALIRGAEDERVRGVSALAIQRINSIWGPTEKEMGLPLYPRSEFIPNAGGEWIFVSKDPLPKITDFFKRHLKKSPLTFQDFKKQYENGFGEADEGSPKGQPNFIFVAEQQQFQGRKYPSKLIFLQANKGETEIKIFHAIGAPD